MIGLFNVISILPFAGFTVISPIEGDLMSVVADKSELVRLATDMKFTEGPVWSKNGYLLFSDIPANTIFKYVKGQKLSVYRRPSGQANGNSLDQSGRLVSCEHETRRVSRTEVNGKITTIADTFEGKKLNSPNDIVVRSDGRIYFTDPPYGIPIEKSELKFWGVYSISPTGELRCVARDFVRPNGLALTPDEKRLYINDTDKSHIRVFDIGKDGILGGDRVFAELKWPNHPGAPDGMKVDTKGNVYCTGPGGVWVFDAKGKKLGVIETPEVACNCAFGDADLKTLYITAQKSLYSIRLKIAGIRPGPK